MAFTIDTTSYPKAKTYPVGHGYTTRPASPTSIVVHSTNNSKPNTSFSSEANYLYTSNQVSADFLIGKDGRIVQFLDSRKHQAWHAGGKQADGTWTAKPEFANPASIGIELHHSTPDPPYPVDQLGALGWLLQNLADQFNIQTSLIETHGQIALPGPYQRKTDPDDWPHADFVRWRDQLFTPFDPLTTHSIAGPGGIVYRCGSGFHAYYHADGRGFDLFGYALSSEAQALDAGGRKCTYMRFERASAMKYTTEYGVELALISEAAQLGWL